MTQPNLARLESGQQNLTEGLMQRFARALDVAPLDLLPLAIVAALQNGAAPDRIRAAPDIAEVLRQRHIVSYAVLTDALSAHGIAAGDAVLVDTSEEAVRSLRTGDMVLAEVTDRANPETTCTVLREFIAPALLTTNRPGTNHAFRTDDEGLAVRIVGVVIQPPPAA